MSKIILAVADDWRTWKCEFRSQADMLDLWKFIDPEDENPPAFMTKPAMPDAKAFLNKVSEAQAAGVDRDASTAALNEFIARSEAYQVKRDVYRDETERKMALRDWISTTVNINIQILHQDGNLRVYYGKLLACFDAHALRLARAKAINNWNDFFYATPRVPQDPMKWVDEFVSVMREADSAELPLTKCALVWLLPLQQQAEPFLEISMVAMQSQFRKEIEDDSLSYTKIAEFLRFEISLKARVQNNSHQGGEGGEGGEGGGGGGGGRGRGGRRRPKNKARSS
ncbi:hypothetical protein EDB81DRAFT_352663 [Dactylonectria macrodidyma]|uniref:Uncharacterized protein n=1 Tax=Dactylonectria macrodidyma TaxID=307937 RepID=A0A9P9FH91_9HYPO|nr:hypothetical protein EDB81DRAFT_352663 [Dactylonectria macrodidyma]